MPTLLQRLLEVIALTPAEPAVLVRFVSPAGNDAANGRTAASAYQTIARALQDAVSMKAYQYLDITLASAVYRDMVSLPSRVTLRGDPANRPLIQPQLQTGPVVSANGCRDVALIGLSLAGGRRRTTDKTGGGLHLVGAVGVLVRDCDISDNQGYRGGGIHVRGCRDVRIEACRIARNSAGTRDTAVAGAGFDLLSFEVVYVPGDGHGGGVYVSDSDAVEVRACRIVDNNAVLFGGGIAIDNSAAATEPPGSVRIVDNDIHCNTTICGATGALNLPTSSCQRGTVTDHLFDEMYDNTIGNAAVSGKIHAMVNALHGGGRESGMGGGIALRRVSSATRLEANRIGGLDDGGASIGNLARRGGGIACFTSAYPTLIGNEVALNAASDDGGGVSIDQFDPFLPGKSARYGIAPRPMTRRESIVLDDNVIRDNTAGSDGGGLYATGSVQLSITASGGHAAFTGNTAMENGGGVRVSYATRLAMSDVLIDHNRANLKGESNGGGGLAARNSSVTLRRCKFRANSSAGRGGAVYFVSCFEGGIGWNGFIANQHEIFDDLMEKAFGFRTRVLRLIDCTGDANASTGSSGAGGFLYAIRDPVLGGTEPLWVVIDGADTRLGANVSDYSSPTVGMRKRANVSIELSGLRSGVQPQDRVYLSPLLTAGAIPASTALDGTSGPSVIVMTEADASHDIRAAPGFVWGPKPQITSVTPAFAPEWGGRAVRMTGAGFEGGMQVTFGDQPPREVDVASATEATLITPSLSPGGADVTVTLMSGPGTVSTNAVRILTSPWVTGLIPRRGPPGIEVELSGHHFVQPLVVEAIGPARSATIADVTWVSESTLRFRMPEAPGGASTVALRVTLPSGESAQTADAAFAYGPA